MPVCAVGQKSQARTMKICRADAYRGGNRRAATIRAAYSGATALEESQIPRERCSALHGAGLSQRDNLYLTLLTQPLPRYASALPHAPSGVTESATRRESVLTGTMQKNGDGARSRIYFAPFARTSAFLCLKSDRIVPDKTGCNPHTRFRNGFGVDIECRFATVSRLILI